MKTTRCVRILAAFLLSALSPAANGAAEAPRVEELRTQRVNGITYFQVRFATPEAMQLPRLERWQQYANPNLSPLARLPRLIPQDDKTRCVYPHLVLESDNPRPGIVRITPPQLEFAGRMTAAGEATFLLLYPTGMRRTPPRESLSPARWLPQYEWAEAAVSLDFRKAKQVAVPGEAARRSPARPLENDDLEGLWASSQAAQFAVLESLTPEFGFYGFARVATGRKYRVSAPSLGEPVNLHDRERIDRQLYENLTGAAAIADMLAQRRLLVPDSRAQEERTVDIHDVEGIALAERPYEKLLGDSKPAPEPLAKFVPEDNYYLEFKNIARLLEFSELVDQWGTCLSRAFQVASRDPQIHERMERQLCIRTDVLAKTLGPYVVRGLAVTGSDGYLREGSDVALVIHAVTPNLMVAAQNRFIAEARKEHGDRLRFTKLEYHKITIESYVTPLREVSLYRAVIGNFVIQCNSLAGVKRIIDTHQGRHKSLGDAPDFRYMRTVFRMDDKKEDGFLFLSDAFLRRQVSPDLKIKEKRRLEGLTSLYMANHAALLRAWETRRLPADGVELLAGAALKHDEIAMPEGKEITWDAGQRVAISPTYNTLDFAAPLLELPIDKISESERRAYERFRDAYVTVWRQYFDPIGLRLSVSKKQVRIETCTLPLAGNSAYTKLRRLIGGGTITVDSSTFHPKALVHFLSHFTPLAQDRAMIGDRIPMRVGGRALNLVGRALMVRLDDSPVYLSIADLAFRQELDPDARPVSDEEFLRLESSIPLTAGIEVKRPRLFAALLVALNAVAAEMVPDLDSKPAGPPYRGVPIIRVQFPDQLFTGKEGDGNKSHVALYYMIFDGNLFASLSQAPLKELIDAGGQRPQNQQKDDASAAKVNATCRVSLAAAGPATQRALRFLLEWETQRRVLANEPAWYALYHTGVLAKDASPKAARLTALRYLGSVPVSADNSPFIYEARTDEVISPRHGSLRQPRLQEGVEADSPLGRLLGQIRSIRADLRFGDDGLHTVLTLERN